MVSSFPVGIGPIRVAYDGANVWVANNFDGTVTKLRASDGACVGRCTFSVGGASAGAGGIAFDGTYIWVSNPDSSTVTKLQANGSNVGVFQLGSSANTPFAVAFDGANIWVAFYYVGQGGGSGVYKV
jgi:hypothetical protein